jgi:curli biogenesis system outer membrane secretion channel CsgG
MIKFIKPFALFSLAILAGCAKIPSELRREVLNKGDLPVVMSSNPTLNNTPLTAKLACYGGLLEAAHKENISIAVGNIRDYTGKTSNTEGFLVTQGGALMAYTALGHLVPGITLLERFDTLIADAELTYMSNRQLGDGRMHSTVDPSSVDPSSVDPTADPAPLVPWKPYFGGSVLQSDYYIVGGITELNYNLQSGGGEFSINNVGGKHRLYTINVGIDLRIVGSQSLKVFDTVSIQKQITGYEVGLDVFRFFNSDLFDVNAGAKSQEPLQLAIRMAIESAILDLVPSITGVKPIGCQSVVPLVEEDRYVGGKYVGKI